MCGIAGIWKLNGQAVQEGELYSFRDRLSHRGPDGCGAYFDGSLAFGHRRLSVLDITERAKQPMISHDGRYIITYNGEIFNFIELRDQLKSLGHSFRSDSDTEVILAAYKEWGKDCLLKFNGMWAFAIWDAKKRNIFLARDRYGIKPMYYAYVQDFLFAFASETIAFGSLAGFKKKINKAHVSMALNNVFSLESKALSLFDNIYQLEPGNYVEWDGRGALNSIRWWYPSQHLIEVPEKYEDQIEQFRALFEDACRIRLRSDVQVGTALSGGVDSSAVYCMVNHIMKQGSAIRTPAEWQLAFVGSFPGSGLDERVYAEQVTTFIKGKAEYISFHADKMVRTLEADTKHFETIYMSPLSVASEIYKKMNEAGVVVSLDGHGVDEMMYGYPNLVAEAYAHARVKFDHARARELSDVYMHMSNTYDPESDAISLRDNFSFIKNYIKQYAHFLPSSIVRGRKKNPFLREYDFSETKAKQLRIPASEPWLHINFYDSVLPTLLRNFDRASMKHAIEIRMPFMDWRLVSFVFSLPEKSKVGAGYSKRILRDSMAGLMPETIRTRKTKIGINAPLHEWFSHELKEYVLDIVHSSDFMSSSIWDGRKIADFVDMNAKRSTWSWDDAISVWPFINAYILMK